MRTPASGPGHTDAREAGAGLRFIVVIQVWHKSVDPDALTAAFGRQPFRCWRAGTPRTTMQGKPLAGDWPQSYWVARRRVAGQRRFFQALEEEVTMLEAQRALIGRLVADGGRVALTVDLAGDANIGDELPAAMLARLGALGIGLGIEVFPEMR